MKRYFESTIFGLLSLLAFTACSEDEGTEPGGDGMPHVAITQSSVAEPYDADIDQNLRFAVNQQTEAVYYLAEKTADKEARSMNADAYADYVVSNGTQVQLVTDEQSGGKYGDVVATGMKGAYTITAVAVGGGQKVGSSVAFTGPNWIDVTKGTYHFSERAQGRLGVAAEKATVLQYLESNPAQYRFKNLYGYGASLQMTLSDKKGSDDTGELQYFRVEPQTTPFTYGDYGTVSVRDLGYWQDDDSYAFDPDYGCFIYTNANKNGVVLALQYFVSAGSLGYGWDEFEPGE
jgi:hypothetical protein